MILTGMLLGSEDFEAEKELINNFIGGSR